MAQPVAPLPPCVWCVRALSCGGIKVGFRYFPVLPPKFNQILLSRRSKNHQYSSTGCLSYHVNLQTDKRQVKHNPSLTEAIIIITIKKHEKPRIAPFSYRKSLSSPAEFCRCSWNKSPPHMCYHVKFDSSAIKYYA